MCPQLRRIKKILLVDDDAAFRRLLRCLVVRLGYDVVEVDSGESALEKLREPARYNAVLLDLRMPGLGGLETLHAIKTRDARLPVIMVTAVDEVEDAVHAIKAGAYDYLVKPVVFSRLQVSLQNAVRLHELEVRVGPDADISDLAGTAPLRCRSHRAIHPAGRDSQ